MTAKLNPLHWHACYACGQELTCCCPDHRQVDLVNGKDRRLYCIECAELREVFQAFSESMQEVSLAP